MPHQPLRIQIADSPDVSRSLKAQLEALPPGALPLHLGTNQGGRVDDSDISVTVLSVDHDADTVQARVGVFFTEVVGNCACGDEPHPQTVYCVLRLNIDKTTGETCVELAPEQGGF